MQIASDIMKMVEKAEEYKKNFSRCLNTLICPQCGAVLTSKDIGGENLIEIEYTCPNCQFKHKRLES